MNFRLLNYFSGHQAFVGLISGCPFVSTCVYCCRCRNCCTFILSAALLLWDSNSMAHSDPGQLFDSAPPLMHDWSYWRPFMQHLRCVLVFISVYCLYVETLVCACVLGFASRLHLYGWQHPSGGSLVNAHTHRCLRIHLQ